MNPLLKLVGIMQILSTKNAHRFLKMVLVNESWVDDKEHTAMTLNEKLNLLLPRVFSPRVIEYFYWMIFAG